MAATLVTIYTFIWLGTLTTTELTYPFNMSYVALSSQVQNPTLGDRTAAGSQVGLSGCCNVVMEWGGPAVSLESAAGFQGLRPGVSQLLPLGLTPLQKASQVGFASAGSWLMHTF